MAPADQWNNEGNEAQALNTAPPSSCQMPEREQNQKSHNEDFESSVERQIHVIST